MNPKARNEPSSGGEGRCGAPSSARRSCNDAARGAGGGPGGGGRGWGPPLVGANSRLRSPAAMPTSPGPAAVMAATAPVAVTASSPDAGIGVDGSWRPDQSALTEAPFWVTATVRFTVPATETAPRADRPASAFGGRVTVA